MRKRRNDVTCSSKSFADGAAGDACTGIARRLRNLIIGCGVNHDRAAIVIEQCCRSGGKCHTIRREGGLRSSVGCDRDIWRVTSVRTCRIVETVLSPDRILVSTGG